MTNTISLYIFDISAERLTLIGEGIIKRYPTSNMQSVECQVISTPEMHRGDYWDNGKSHMLALLSSDLYLAGKFTMIEKDILYHTEHGTVFCYTLQGSELDMI